MPLVRPLVLRARCVLLVTVPLGAVTPTGSPHPPSELKLRLMLHPVRTL